MTTVSDSVVRITFQSHASVSAPRWRSPAADGSWMNSAPIVISTESTAISTQSVHQPKWKTHRPTAGATATAPTLASPE